MPENADITPAKMRKLRRGCSAAVSYVDAQLGRIIDELDWLNLADRTIVVLWSDHGFHLGENGQWGKKTNAELDLRVPLMVIAPGRNRPGTRTPAMVELVDLHPALAELAGLPRDAALHGTSFVPMLDDAGRRWKNAVFSHYIRGGVQGRAIRTATDRYVERARESRPERVDVELYDLETDPFERNDLAVTDTEAVARHAALLERGWARGCAAGLASAPAPNRYMADSRTRSLSDPADQHDTLSAGTETRSHRWERPENI